MRLQHRSIVHLCIVRIAYKKRSLRQNTDCRAVLGNENIIICYNRIYIIILNCICVFDTYSFRHRVKYYTHHLLQVVVKKCLCTFPENRRGPLSRGLIISGQGITVQYNNIIMIIYTLIIQLI